MMEAEYVVLSTSCDNLFSLKIRIISIGMCVSVVANIHVKMSHDNSVGALLLSVPQDKEFFSFWNTSNPLLISHIEYLLCFCICPSQMLLLSYRQLRILTQELVLLISPLTRKTLCISNSVWF